MSKRVLTGAVTWVVLTVGAFLLDPILGAAVLVFGGILVTIGHVASTWGDASSYEERELVRARRRAEARQANSGKREKERARYRAAMERKAARAARKGA
ncbi:hypothetical protein [Modestobacter sp. Leaf380]|uniref:hypothetical protein n=1 Tax=Modestobacter sp. Leaf380 TaxID=1736356 RepID=UPI0006F7A1C0|nr:hypothetical protein [Modestobacter sp. Leaf380]KQS69184.1 hypothetical protein ASG41_22175 [Modestobacter sp. Leaf380]